MRHEIQNGSNNFSESIAEVPPIGSKFDNASNDSNKSWTVPGNEQWKINHAHVILATTATGGNRLITCNITDADGNSFDIQAGTTQAASLTRHYLFLQGFFRETTFVNNELQVPLPYDLWLPPGWSIQFYDATAVDAAADDMTVFFQYKKFQV